MSIIISQDGKNAQKIDRSDFEKEDYLQNYIHENPGAIPVYEIEEDKKLFVVKREFAPARGLQPARGLALQRLQYIMNDEGRPSLSVVFLSSNQ